MSDIIFYILYFKSKNSNMLSIKATENDKNNKFIFSSIIFKNNIY